MAVSNLRAALAQASGGLRSSLYSWMRENHDELADLFAREGPRWRAFAKWAAENGLRDRAGKPPSVRTAQKTWYRAKADEKADREKRKVDQAPSPREPGPAPKVRDALPPSPARPDEEGAKMVFKPIRRKDEDA